MNVYSAAHLYTTTILITQLKHCAESMNGTLIIMIWL